MAKTDEQDKRQETEARVRGEAEARAKARAEQPEPGSAAARTYGTPATSTGEPQPHQPPPREDPPAPRAEFPKWKYSKDEAGVVVDTKEAEDQRGEGWQDRPVPFGPEDTKGMKVTDETLKKYTDAVYPKGWRDDGGKRTDENALAAAKASREVRGIKEGEEGESKKDEAAQKEQERVEKDFEERERQEKELDQRDRERLEREQQERQQQRDREREQTKQARA